MKASHIALLVTVLLGTASTASALTCKEKYELALFRAELNAPLVCSADDPSNRIPELDSRRPATYQFWAPRSSAQGPANAIRPVAYTCCDQCYVEYHMMVGYCNRTYPPGPSLQYCHDMAWDSWCWCNQSCGGNCGWGPCNG